MKKYLLLFVLFGEFLMSACFNEDEIHAELGGSLNMSQMM